MDRQPIIHNTFVVERSFSKSPEQVFAAFADPAKMRRWFAEGRGHDVEEFRMDFKVGGTQFLEYKLNASTPFPGLAISNEGKFLDIVPNNRIVMGSSMHLAGKFISASLLTIEFVPTDKGTDLICTHHGSFLEGSGGPKMREEGWRTLFEKLATELAN